jgi:hypothetical protein
MRRRLGQLGVGGKSSWRRLGALRRSGVGGLTAAATTGIRFGIRVLQVGLRACRGAGHRFRAVLWALSSSMVFFLKVEFYSARVVNYTLRKGGYTS